MQTDEKLINIILTTLCILCILSCTRNNNKYGNYKEDTIKNPENQYKDSIGIEPQRNQITKPLYLKSFTTYNLCLANKLYVKVGGKNDDGAVYLSADSSNRYGYSVGFSFGLNRCGYQFATKDENNRIKLIWDTKGAWCDVTNSIKKTFGLKKYPKKGDVFAELFLIGDSAIGVNYFYSEFIDKQNEAGRNNKGLVIDTLFPKYFRCSTCEWAPR